MVWSPRKQSAMVESRKIMWEIVPYTRGDVLEIGCGSQKTFQHFTGVDNLDHQKFGFAITPDIKSEGDDLFKIASGSHDAVFASHVLEHFVRPEKALAEWFRVIKTGGHLVLYYPHEDFYPRVGQKGANPDHKANLNNELVIEWMRGIGSWDLLKNQKRNGGDEYSAYQVFRKLESGPCLESWKDAPEKTAIVCRFGAFGDLLQSSSVIAGLKAQGFHVSLMCSPPQHEVMLHDPNIDCLMLQDKNQVPNERLWEYWDYWAKNCTKFVNLSESVEGTLLALRDRIQYRWPQSVRHERMNGNYLEFQHQLAEVPHLPAVRFYPTQEERFWASEYRKRMARRVVVWALAGSAVHKAWPWADQIVQKLLSEQDTEVVLVGGAQCTILEAGWVDEPRVHRTSGKWSIRQVLAFLECADLVVGPETGVLNAASCLDVPKIVFLSHSSHENLCRDWVNTISLAPRAADVSCFPCHMLHMNADVWKNCKQHVETGAALCQAMIGPDLCWQAVEEQLGLV